MSNNIIGSESNLNSCVLRGGHDYQRVGKLRESILIQNLDAREIKLKLKKGFHFYECKTCLHYSMISNNDWYRHYA